MSPATAGFPRKSAYSASKWQSHLATLAHTTLTIAAPSSGKLTGRLPAKPVNFDQPSAPDNLIKADILLVKVKVQPAILTFSRPEPRPAPYPA